MYKIREVSSKDYNRINAIHQEPAHMHLQNAAPIDEQQFKSILSKDDIKMYVVEKSGSVAAFILFQINQFQQTIFIEKLSVEHTYRKKGLDEHLYHKVKQLADRTGMKHMLTNINVDDPDVYDFFERKGWKYVMEMDRYEIELK